MKTEEIKMSRVVPSEWVAYSARIQSRRIAARCRLPAETAETLAELAYRVATADMWPPDSYTTVRSGADEWVAFIVAAGIGGFGRTAFHDRGPEFDAVFSKTDRECIERFVLWRVC